MSSSAPADPEAIVAAVDRFEAARADLAALSFDALTAAQALSIKDRLETVSRPDALRKAAERLLALVHPDGDFSDADRARRRHLTTGHQQADGMSPISGMLDPEARATLEAVLAKWASPGMCNPDDETPCVDGTPSDAAIHNDQRSPAQRHHDALKAMGRSVLTSGELGQHHGLPCTLIVTTTLQELEAGCGQTVTATGTLLPMPTVIKLASHAYHYLSVFDKHTGRALYLGRTRRIASPDQRIVLLARDRGCTRPGCRGQLPSSARGQRLGRRRPNQHRRPHPGLPQRQPQRQARRLDHPKTTYDPTTTTRTDRRAANSLSTPHPRRRSSP